ncbi:Protein CBR-TWK-20 [Caenorhabditis briggsae]|uniref:Two pore potassium channel protein sup-9 n=1 Tax=Caenorhabditis briggsae TaxID=6238 RepID=A8X4U9_CAEBR|nr:Protein CBR-TWK-20 [Caenorhabditis briggsae]CAP27659.2 Protein CBR-TWK-20 [Caenorhabditis briggsae]
MNQIDGKSARALLLILSTFTYLLFGAMIFDKLESEDDNRVRDEIERVTERLKNKYNFSERDMHLFEAIAIKSIPQQAGYQWQFAGAFYFATVVITTVGYGHSAPSTLAGKLFCMIFALFGIPMGLVMFQSIGERVNTFIAYSLHKFRDNLHQQGYTCLQEVTPTHLLMVSFTIGFLVIVSVSTIGFGDLVPLQQTNALQEKPLYVFATILFILVGLAVFSACVNLLVLGFMASNADEVTAANREPPSAIVLERFARNSLVESQLFNIQKHSTVGVLPGRPRRMYSIVPNSAGDVNIRRQSTRRSIQDTVCCGCFKPRPPRHRFSLTRRPTNISHLVDLELY